MSAQFDPTPHYTLKSPPEKLLKAAKIAVAIGVVCFVAGLLIEGYGKRIRVAYLTNLVYFIGLSLGGLIFACTLTLTLARWGRGLKRIGESFLMFMPVALALLAVFILTGGLELYEWYTHPETLHAHKAIYLTTPFWVARLFIGLALV